jgi:protein-L-isoaspartate(D-aspartate) O-methyltransferase
MQDEIKRLQECILEDYRHLYADRPLRPATEEAFRQTPRHAFIRRYKVRENDAWNDVSPNNLSEHLTELYADHPLFLFHDGGRDEVSTVSQPTLVLYMLELLQVETGQRICELGAGSGWNAALLGHLAGPSGRVFSIEIIPEMQRAAEETIRRLGRSNVRIVHADGGAGYEAEAPYDRMVFTVGAYDIPAPLYSQVRTDGLLLIVLKARCGADTLYLMRKRADHFESITSLLCGFVSLTGAYRNADWAPVPLADAPDWARVRGREVDRRPFWWGGKGTQGFWWRTVGIRTFLDMTEPGFEIFSEETGGSEGGQSLFFGVWSPDRQSLALARDDQLIGYGKEEALERLLRRTHEWVDLGMPTGACRRLRTYPAGSAVRTGRNEWITERDHSQFVWSLDEGEDPDEPQENS